LFVTINAPIAAMGTKETEPPCKALMFVDEYYHVHLANHVLSQRERREKKS
jgi:hypothetical protein